MPVDYRRRRRYVSRAFDRRSVGRVPRPLRIGGGYGPSEIVMRRMDDGGIPIPSNTIRTGIGGLIWWKLNDIPSYGTWTSVASQYQIYGIKLVFWIPGNEDTTRWYSGSSVTGQGIELAVCPSHANSAAPIDRYDVINRPYTKIKNLCQGPLKIFIRPSVLTEVHGGVADTDYGPTYDRWLQTSEVDVPHYGLKYWVKLLYTSGTDPVFSDLGVYINYRVTYYLKFKGVHP